MRKFAHAALALALLGVIGCNAKRGIPENLIPLTNVATPVVKSASDPDVDLTTRRTFVIMPVSAVTSDKPAFGDKLVEKRVAFIVRCVMEMHGYTLASASEQPDMVVTVDGTNEYRTTYIPPTTVVVPRYIPGETVQSRINTNGTVWSGYDYGGYSGTSTVNTTTQGRWTTDTVTRPGYEVGHYYPCVSISIYDAATKITAWNGSVVGVSQNPDVRVSCNFGMGALSDRIPVCSAPTSVSSGMIGIVCPIVTLDGDTTYPIVWKVDERSAFERSGGKVGDMIAAIDGQSCANKPYSEVVKTLAGDVGSPCAFTLIRGKKVLEISVKRVSTSYRTP